MGRTQNERMMSERRRRKGKGKGRSTVDQTTNWTGWKFPAGNRCDSHSSYLTKKAAYVSRQRLIDEEMDGNALDQSKKTRK
ncbi:unnamed protein product [Caenorhabditis sp. 36 PRJEB53466]|nr:unnamed protein product [Caenorhabditis sp. 36 PRJEB53466]